MLGESERVDLNKMKSRIKCKQSWKVHLISKMHSETKDWKRKSWTKFSKQGELQCEQTFKQVLWRPRIPRYIQPNGSSGSPVVAAAENSLVRLCQQQACSVSGAGWLQKTITVFTVELEKSVCGVLGVILYMMSCFYETTNPLVKQVKWQLPPPLTAI